MKYAILALTLISSTALAGDENEPDVRYKAITEIDMGELDLKAPIVTPELQAIGESARPVFAPMIQLRKDFAVEMRESVSQLQ